MSHLGWRDDLARLVDVLPAESQARLKRYLATSGAEEGGGGGDEVSMV